MNSRIVDYKVIFIPTGAGEMGPYEEVLGRQVTYAISEGWEPIGGVCADAGCHSGLYQAMVKRVQILESN